MCPFYSLILNKNTTAIYTVNMAPSCVASKKSFKVIHFFRKLIIHDQLETRAMNISDDTHEAVCQSRGEKTYWFVGEMYSTITLVYDTAMRWYE